MDRPRRDVQHFQWRVPLSWIGFLAVVGLFVVLPVHLNERWGETSKKYTHGHREAVRNGAWVHGLGVNAAVPIPSQGMELSGVLRRAGAHPRRFTGVIILGPDGDRQSVRREALHSPANATMLVLPGSQVGFYRLSILPLLVFAAAPLFIGFVGFGIGALARSGGYWQLRNKLVLVSAAFGVCYAAVLLTLFLALD